MLAGSDALVLIVIRPPDTDISPPTVKALTDISPSIDVVIPDKLDPSP